MTLSDQELADWAADAWGSPASSYRVDTYGKGLAICAETRDASFQIRIAIDHADARPWLAILLREVARERERVSRQSQQRTRLSGVPPPPMAPLATHQHVGGMLSPFPLSPSAAPPPDRPSPSPPPAAQPSHEASTARGTTDGSAASDQRGSDASGGGD